MRPGLFHYWLLLLPLLISGCAHYRAGTPDSAIPVGDRLYIAQVVNRSYAPQVRTLMSNELNNVFAQSALIRLVPDTNGAWVLSVVLEEFDREAVATRQDDTGRALSFDLNLTARITLVSPKGVTVLDGETVQADTTVYATQGLTAAEYDSMPLLTRALAQRIRNTVENLW
ncbi:MAG: LPS assembly lipoprotein LptE [Verrucomicrobia bacterium]|nr:LPS assembly lipoprotein LptE [Verrucomicrobiota bacterium]